MLDTPSLTRAVNEARLRHRSTLPELRELLARSAGRATKRLRPRRLRHEPDREAVRLETTLAARAPGQ